MEEQSKAIVPVEHNNQRILTTAQLAQFYGTDEKYINRNYQNNKSRYTEGKHFYRLEGETLQRFLALQGENLPLQNVSKLRVLYLWTEKGALQHAKSLSTDEAWNMYEKLVDDYYRKGEDILVLRERSQLLLPERITDKQAMTVLEQIQTMVHEEQLVPEMNEVKRYNLEFALKKAQGYMNGHRIQTFNLKDKPNKWGEVRIKEYPDETEEDREYRLRKEHAIREKNKTQDEELIEQIILEYLGMYGLVMEEELLDATDAQPDAFRKVVKRLLRTNAMNETQRGRVTWYESLESPVKEL